MHNRRASKIAPKEHIHGEIDDHYNFKVEFLGINPPNDPFDEIFIAVNNGEHQWILLRSYDDFYNLQQNLKNFCVPVYKHGKFPTLHKYSKIRKISHTEFNKILPLLYFFLLRLTLSLQTDDLCPFLAQFISMSMDGQPQPVEIKFPQQALCRAITTVEAQEDEDLSLEEGDIIYIVDKSAGDDGGWLRGIKTKEGVIPRGENHVEIGLFQSSSVYFLEKTSNSYVDLIKGERVKKIVCKMKNFFAMRPAREFLTSRGVIKSTFFSRPLEDLEPEKVESFVGSCLSYVEENGIVAGIYRISGGVKEVERMRNCVNDGDFSFFDESPAIHDVGQLIKRFFHEIQGCIIPLSLHKEIISVVFDGQLELSDKAEGLGEIFLRISEISQKTLFELSRHLMWMCSKSEVTKMTLSEIVMVWVCNIFCNLGSMSTDSIEDYKATIEKYKIILDFILTNYQLIFNFSESE